MNIKDLIISKSVGNLYWKDMQGRYQGCNNAFADMIGLASPEAIVGKTDRDLFLASLGEEKLNRLISQDQAIMREGREKTIEEVGVDDQKRIAYYITHKSPLRDEKGNIIGLIGTSINITKEKEAVFAKQVFLENMSHDIRTPLAGIYGLTQILYEDCRKENWDPEAIVDILGDIKQSAGALLAFLDSVLQVAELGRNPVKKEKINLHLLMDEITQLLSLAIKQKGLHLEIDCAEVFVYTDKSQLLRILLNLVSNAIKFTSKGGICVNVQMACQDVLITVADTGIGMPEEKLNQIFDQFYKIKPSNQLPEFVGCGLGLYIARSMAEEMGGEITVKSTLNQGSQFTVILKKALVASTQEVLQP